MFKIAISLPHFYRLRTQDRRTIGTLRGPEEWDRVFVRESDDLPTLAFPQTAEQWIAACLADERVQGRARTVVRVLSELGVDELWSLGAGVAALEYLILRAAPNLRLHVSDFAPKTVERLRDYFGAGVQVSQFDMKAGDFATLAGRTVLLNRVDTELSDAEWRTTARRMAAADIRRILFIPGEILGWKRALVESVHRLQRRLAVGNCPIFAGYVRNRHALEALFEGAFRRTRVIPLDTVELWVLDRIQ